MSVDVLINPTSQKVAARRTSASHARQEAQDTAVHAPLGAGFGKKRTRADGGSTRWLHCEGRPSFTAKNRYGMPPKIMIPKDFSFGAALAPFFPPAAAE
jgi:hypothetical protein